MTINPPGLASKSYELYKQELLAWREVTEVCRSKQGIVIALTLPNEEPFKVRENVLNNLSLDELKRENGLDTLIQYLNVYLEKDDLSDRFEKYEDFENFQRTNGQNIREFIADFDSKYRKLLKMSINLPPEILAFKLLKTVNITKHQKMLVLTGVNFSNKETIYEDMKQLLRKFIGNSTENSLHIGSNVKLEPEFLAKHERELFKAGYVKQPYGGDMRNLHGGSCTENGGQNCGLVPMGKKRNPVGMNGKLLKCKSCGSYRHLVAECPDSWENMEKNTSETKQYYVLNQRNSEKRISKGLKMFEPEEANIPSKVAELSVEMSSLKTEIRRLEAEIIADKDRKQEEQTRRFLESMVEELQQRILKLEKEKQFAQEEKEVFIRDLQKEQEVTAKRNMELMLFILLRENLSSGFEKPSLKERIIQVNQKNELEEMNVEKLKGMINEFKVIQEYVEETKQAILGIHKSVSEREAGIGTMINMIKPEKKHCSYSILRKWVSVVETEKQVNQAIEIYEMNGSYKNRLYDIHNQLSQHILKDTDLFV